VEEASRFLFVDCSARYEERKRSPRSKDTLLGASYCLWIGWNGLAKLRLHCLCELLDRLLITEAEQARVVAWIRGHWGASYSNANQA